MIFSIQEEELWIDSWLDGMMRLQMQIGLETYHHLRQAFTSNNLCCRCLYVISICIIYVVSNKGVVLH